MVVHVSDKERICRWWLPAAAENEGGPVEVVVAGGI